MSKRLPPNATSEDAHDKEQPPIRVHIVKSTTNVTPKLVATLNERAKKRGAAVIPFFQCPQPPKKRRRGLWGDQVIAQPVLPTHLVFHQDCSAKGAAESLKFPNREHMEKYLNANSIRCATLQWIIHGKGPLKVELDHTQRWHRIDSIVHKRTAAKEDKKDGLTNIQRLLGKALQKQRNNSQQLSQSHQRAENSQISSSQQEPAEDVSDDEDEKSQTTRGRFASNLRVAEQLQILGKLHQKCPVTPEDMWKAYSLDKVAGRIRNLDFEVSLGKESQAKLTQVWGVGASTREKIKEILTTGTCKRIQEFQTDRQRVAMKNLVGIWGIGRSTAQKLLNQGIETIEDVRARLDELELDRNQRIGVECYEDILENMSRPEVEAIGKVIEEAIRRQFPTADDKNKLEITIMGSYRRGKDACGDVDVLITHKDYTNRVPPHVLGEVVEDLLDRGDMAYHLTFIPGMKIRTGDEYHPGGYNKQDGMKSRSDKESISSYMGVFNSPTIKGKRRRVDIKFYPHRERAFAWLYFTGNGFFNRSMRLYASKRKGLQMNDKGLFTRNGKERVLEASTEKEVFDFLGLEYKEPHERDCFDAVIMDDDLDEAQEKKEILREEENHKWID